MKWLLLSLACLTLAACVPKSDHEKLQSDFNAQSAQLKQEQAKNKQLAEDLGKAQAEALKLSGEVRAGASEISNLKTELAETTGKLSKANDTLTQTSTELSRTTANLKKELEKKPVLPVKLTFRAAVLGEGQVLQIFNDASQDLPVRLIVKRPATDKTKDFELVLRGNSTIEFGHAEGWAFHSGDVIVLKNNGYEQFQSIAR
jgi:septal ring factor EnvC (AmiA/AmiB activator)